MAVVMEYTTSNGVHVTFHDDAYKDKTEEEKEALRRNIDKTINELLANMARRKQVG